MGGMMKAELIFEESHHAGFDYRKTRLNAPTTSGGGIRAFPWLFVFTDITSSPLWWEVHRLLPIFHAERSHWFIWPPPNARLMGLADASSPTLRFMWALDWLSITSLAHWSRSSDEKLKAEQFITVPFGSNRKLHPHDWLEEHQGLIGLYWLAVLFHQIVSPQKKTPSTVTNKLWKSKRWRK